MNEQPEPCDIVPFCPVCSAPMHQAHKLQTLHICVCLACETTLTVTDEALKQFRAQQSAKTLT
jgi:hypothetical protein